MDIKKRINWIDICKAIGIIIVVLGHVGIPKNIDIWLHSFHMPLFFILSGLCFNEIKHKKILKFLKNRFKSLIIPYVFFSIFLYLCWGGIMYLYDGSKVFNLLTFVDCIFKPASVTKCFGTVNWFLPSLFFVETIFFLIGKLFKYSKIKIFMISVIIFIIAFIYPIITNYRIPLAIDTTIMGLFFYSIGWLIKKINYEKIIEVVNSHLLVSTLAVIVSLIVFYSLIELNNMTNMRTLVYGKYSLYLINSVGMSLIMIFISIIINNLSLKIKVLNILKTIGRHTLVILLFNPVLSRLYLLLNEKDFNNSILLTVNNVIVSIIITVICVLISMLINNYCPILLGKQKKK